MEEILTINPLLARKYNGPVPRYTSYPAVPFWENNLASNKWSDIFNTKFNNHNHTDGISIYIHLPFCESLCSYCGCDKIITTNHKVEEEYLLAIEKEWKLYRNLMQQTPVIREIHLGGGTPTFFSAKNLQRLLSLILKNSIVHPVYEFSIEAHPNNTTKKQLEILYALGFRRISFGVADNDPEVQRANNRIQPFANVKNATETARAAGFTSVNFDLIYGLPKQTIESVEKTIEQVMGVMPERITFYSYDQSVLAGDDSILMERNAVPDAENKISMYLKGKDILMRHGYYDIGMDHFTLPHDSLYKALRKGKLHRNFMGYTTQDTGLLLGLGVSGISDTGTAFAQNIKPLQDYYASVNNNQLPISKGYILNDEDKLFRKNILDISCKGKTTFTEKQSALLEQYTFPQLASFAKEELVSYDRKGVEVTRQGHFFIRNICSAFDMHFQRNRSIAGGAVSLHN